MVVIEIDMVDAESLERLLARLLDIRRSARNSRLLSLLPPELYSTVSKHIV